MVGSFITDYIKYTLAKSEVPNIYIVGRSRLWQKGLKTDFYP